MFTKTEPHGEKAIEVLEKEGMPVNEKILLDFEEQMKNDPPEE